MATTARHGLREPALPGPGPGSPRWARHPLVRLLVLTVALLVVTLLGQAVRAAGGGAAAGLLVGAGTAAAALATYAVCVRLLEHRRVTELPLAAAGPALLRGLLGGTALFVVTIAVIAALGGYRVVGWGSVAGALSVLGLMTGVAVTEELLFRGALFRLVEERGGTGTALGVSAALFGALHLVTPAATPWGAVAVAAEAGLLLGAAYVATRTLWLPVGLHLGWNLAEAGIFTTAVSGSEVGAALLDGVTSSPVLLTGGTFGPEASLVAVVVCSAGALVLLRLAHHRGHLVPRRSRR
jgi:hypothetical protein